MTTPTTTITKEVATLSTMTTISEKTTPTTIKITSTTNSVGE